MNQQLSNILLAFQLILFLLARIMDNLSWYTLNIYDEQNTCEIIAIVFLITAAILNFTRKWQIDGILKIMLIRSQTKFLIPWSLQILLVILFFNTFTCSHQHSDHETTVLTLLYQSCILNGVQMMLTNLTYSLAVNTKTHIAELIVYESVLFSQIIFNGNLLILFVNNLDHQPKDLSILYTSISIANQILIMDLIFRKAYQDRQIQQLEQRLGNDISEVNKDVITARKLTAGIQMTQLVRHTYDPSILKN